MAQHLHRKEEPRVAVYLAILIMIALQIGTGQKVTLGPKYTLAGLELLLVVAAALTHASGNRTIRSLKRSVSLLFIVVVSLANIGSLVLVIQKLVSGSEGDGRRILLSAIAIYLTNILIFGLWYWEMDCPGLTGFSEPKRGPDFLFPQMGAREADPAIAVWQPQFLDYLYISITNASAFSPTDTLPLTIRAKSVMTLQSLTSLATVALVAARAVNVLR